MRSLVLFLHNRIYPTYNLEVLCCNIILPGRVGWQVKR
jgi:hypothetical protein